MRLRSFILLLGLSAFSSWRLMGVSAEKALEWESAYLLQDTKKLQSLADEIYNQDPQALMRCYQVRARAMAGDCQGAWALWKSMKIASSSKYQALEIEAIRDLSWAFLRDQLQTASAEVWLFVCEQIKTLHERQVCELVLLALDHTDLRVQLAALELVGAYPQDVYRSRLMQMFKRSAHPLVRSQLLLLCANMAWPEAEQMAGELTQMTQLSRLEFVALAQYQMLIHKFNPELILSMAHAIDPLEQRLGAWLLRFCPLEQPSLVETYRHVLASHDEMAVQLAMDTLAGFHLPLTGQLQQTLDEARAQGAQERALQIDWLLAMAGGEAKVYELWLGWAQKGAQSAQLFAGNSSWQWNFCQLTSWLTSAACYYPKCLEKAWLAQKSIAQQFAPQELPWSLRVQLACGLILTRNSQKSALVQEAAQTLKSFLEQSQDLWKVDTLWLDHPALSTQPPGWMPGYRIHASGWELRWSLLELLAHVNPKGSFEIAWKLSQSLPMQWNTPMLWLAWRLALDSLPESVQAGRELIWLKTVLLSSVEDKKRLLEQWSASDPWWKERILDALLQQGDAADLPNLVAALEEPGAIRLKACCAILKALRQGYRPVGDE